MAATADTAKLLASLDLQDNLSPKLRGAVAGVANAETAVGRLGTRLSTFSANLRGGLSNALGTFTGRLRQFTTASLGILGIGGAFAIGKEISDSIGKAKEFGEASRNLAELLKLPIEETSRLSDALDYFGIKAADQTRLLGMAQKNIATYTATTDKAKLFQQQFGLSLEDSNGQVLTGTRLLLALSSYWDQKGIPQQTKVLALSKLFGRSYQTLLPLLREGRGEFEKQLAAAMHLSQEDLDAILANDRATKDWNDSLADLQTQIGIKILPTLTKMLTGAKTFITQNGPQIIDFFRKGAEFVGQIPDWIGQNVLPIIQAIKTGWESIPSFLRDLLVKGLVADRVVKFLFGFSPAELVIKAGAGLFSGIASAVGKGVTGKAVSKVLPQDVIVVAFSPVAQAQLAAGGTGGLLGGAAGAAGGAAAAATGLAGATAAAAASILATIGIVGIGAALIPYVIAAALPKQPTNVISESPAFKSLVGSRPSGTSDPRLGQLHSDLLAIERKIDVPTPEDKALGRKMGQELTRIRESQQKAEALLSRQRALQIASRMETHVQSNVHVTVNTRVSVSDVRKASYSSSSAYDTAVNTFGNKIENIPFD